MSIELTALEGGRILRIALNAPPRNVLDGAMLAELTEACQRFRSDAMPMLRAVLLTANGAHFSYGASIAEHLPEAAPTMLRVFHDAVLALARPCIPIICAVRGQCLGGGLELALLATKIFAAPDARLGQPELRLASFAPAASILLPKRIGQSRAEDLLLTGRVVTAEEARTLGLIDVVADDPEAAALAWIGENLLALSAPALRIATRAARMELLDTLEGALPAMERLYVRELLTHADAREGITAFMERRAPKWSESQ